MKTTKIALFVLLALGILAATYFVGYHKGKHDETRRFLGECLNKDIFLYSKAESRDLAGIKGILGKFISGEFKYYEQHFGEDHFVHLDAAREIVTGAATNDEAIKK
jgi:hypothetical protein